MIPGTLAERYADTRLCLSRKFGVGRRRYQIIVLLQAVFERFIGDDDRTEIGY